MLPLKGDYAFFQQGTVVNVGPAVDVGIVQFDGKGNLTGSETVHVNGIIFTDTFSQGTYEVNPDCTGTATWIAIFSNGQQPQNRSASMVIAKQSKEIFIMSTGPGAVLVGTAKK